MTSPVIKTIKLPLPYRLGQVNCYLLESEGKYLLVDTGTGSQRLHLHTRLIASGCTPGNLIMIVITHGDFDHTGNAVYIQDRFGGIIGMHPADAAMAEEGDMFLGRRNASPLVRWISPLLFGFSKTDRFVPGMCLEDGQDFSSYGFEARVLALPGHSPGSIGILTSEGCLLCGDLFDNTKRPALNTLMDDPAAAKASLQALRALDIQTVYPGHGEPFLLKALQES